MNTITVWFGSLLEVWHNATLVDYGNLVLAVVVLGWFIARMSTH